MTQEFKFYHEQVSYQGQKQPLEVFCKKRCSWKFWKIHRKRPVSESLFIIMLQVPSTGIFNEFREIFKNTFFTEHLWSTASLRNLKLLLIVNSIMQPKNSPDINQDECTCSKSTRTALGYCEEFATD